MEARALRGVEDRLEAVQTMETLETVSGNRGAPENPGHRASPCCSLSSPGTSWTAKILQWKTLPGPGLIPSHCPAFDPLQAEPSIAWGGEPRREVCLQAWNFSRAEAPF